MKSLAARSDPLREWVEDVRDKRQCGRLSQERLYLLDVAGFDANVMESKAGESKRTWEMWFDELVEYQVATGTCDVPEERRDAGLGRWLERQRGKNAKGTLTRARPTRVYARSGFPSRGTRRRRARPSPPKRTTRRSSTPPPRW